MPPAARVTDMHVCPMVTGVVPHVGGPILPPGVPTVLIDFLPAATVTNMLTCIGPPDVIAMGSAGVLINYLPAARMGDPTAHGGVIMLGSLQCIIGETGSGGAGGGGGGGGGGAAGVTSGLAASGADAPSAEDASVLSQPGAQGADASTAAPAAATPPTRDGFASQDEAGQAAVAEANPQSIQDNKEYGGLVYQSQDGTYGYTEPMMGTDQGFEPSQSQAPDGSTTVGDYHCHGDYSSVGPSGEAVRTSDPATDGFNSDHFSSTDRRGIAQDGASQPGYKGYLGTPSGNTKVYDPATDTESTM